MRTGSERTATRTLARKLQRPGLYFALPALLLFAIFFAYPLASSLWQSLTRTVGGVTTFVGLDQYARLFSDPLIGKSLFNAGILLVIQVPLMMGLAVALAYLLNQSCL
jgi:lactose/L-arabinose transport system permease protein